MKKFTFWLVIILLCAIGAALKFSTSHEQMPIGCDEFGYLNLSKAMDNDLTFTNHTNRPWLQSLLKTLRDNGITENEISWMITPHAYHVVPGTEKIINQYQPGTSAIISLFPIKYAKQLFPFAGIILLLLIIMIISWNKGQFTYLDYLLPVLVFIMTVSAPFTTELARVNSLLYTFGFLIGGGMLMMKKPLLACFLIALTVNFRIANSILVLPAILFLPFKDLFSKEKLSHNFGILFKTVVICFAAIIPLLIYNYSISEDFLFITYSSIDTAFANSSSLADNLKYYFNFSQKWFLFHLIIISLLILLYAFRKISLSAFIKLMCFPFINYLFFIIHGIKMDYYPYASAMILTGFSFSILSSYTVKDYLKIPGIVLMISAAVLIFISGVLKYNKKEHLSPEEAKNIYVPLCRYDIIWADLYSGTAEYVCNNSGFRYGTTTPRSRMLAMQHLSSAGYTQAILLDDNTVNENVIINEIKQINLKFTIETSPGTGKILILKNGF